YWEPWLANIARLRKELAPDAEVHFGHGAPRNSAPFDWQEGYINTFIDAIKAAEWSDRESAKANVVKRMMDYLPAADLRFLMELSVEPVASRLGLISAAAGD